MRERGLQRRVLRAILVAGCLLHASMPTRAETVLRLFIGAQPAAALRELVEAYSARHPGVRVEIETGGTTPEQQQRYLNAALASKDASFDLALIDVLRPAQWAGANWLEPLDSYLGPEKDALLARMLPAYRTAGVINGKTVALPFSADAQFLYFRKDLLEKYGLVPPRTWDDLKLAVQKVLDGEKSATLRGLEAVGAPVEGAVCTFLTSLWAAGEDLLKDGKPELSGEAARKAFQFWGDLRTAKVVPASLADIPTDRVRQSFQAGNLLFGMSWAYVAGRVQNDADSAARGKFGVMPVPGLAAENPSSCLGGWQIAVSGVSKNKGEAARLAWYLATPEAAKTRALRAGQLPVFTELFRDGEVLGAHPWFAEALPALEAARPRPVTPRYSEVSEIIRTNLHAVLAGTRTIDAALADMNARLAPIFK